MQQMLVCALFQRSTQCLGRKFGPLLSFADCSGQGRTESTLGFVEIGAIGVNVQHILRAVPSGIWLTMGGLVVRGNGLGPSDHSRVPSPSGKRKLCRNHSHNSSIFPTSNPKNFFKSFIDLRDIRGATV
jgi:hypothetical protein